MSRPPNLARAAFSQGSTLETVRTSTSAVIGGRSVERATHDRQVRMALRPVSPSDRKLLPEGLRTEDSLTALTHERLRVEHSQADGAAGADRIITQGPSGPISWRVVGCKDWSPNGFYRYVAVREAAGR